MNDDGRQQIFRRMASPLGQSERATSSSGDICWDDIGFLCEGLAFAGRPLKAATEDVTREYDLGPRGAWIINIISNGVLYPMELASVFAVGRSLITMELTRLERAGLITSQAGRHDKRRSELALTPLGEQASNRIRDEMSRIIRANLSCYSDQEIRQFAQMLRDVRGRSPDA